MHGGLRAGLRTRPLCSGFAVRALDYSGRVVVWFWSRGAARKAIRRRLNNGTQFSIEWKIGYPASKKIDVDVADWRQKTSVKITRIDWSAEEILLPLPRCPSIARQSQLTIPPVRSSAPTVRMGNLSHPQAKFVAFWRQVRENVPVGVLKRYLESRRAIRLLNDRGVP